MKPVIVQKFGGTTISCADRIKFIAEEIAAAATEHKVIAVVSAMADTTDKLIDLAHSVSNKPDPREYDMLITVGERISISLLSMALKDKGLEAISFTGSQAGIITDDYHTEARIIKITAERVKTAIDSGKIAIVAGFQGVSKNREITTLGRGGSDTSAIALACSLEAEYCDIFTDVDGVYSIDPSLIKSKLIERIDYLEMMEMALLGADVLHPRAVEIASRYDLPIRVRSIFKEYECFKKTRSFKFDQGGIGTLVYHQAASLEEVIVKGITSDFDIILIKAEVDKNNDIPFLLKNFSENGIVIKHYYHYIDKNISECIFLVNNKYEQKIIKEFKQTSLRYTISRDLAIISIIGTGSGNSSEIMKKIFSVLSQLKINTNLVSTSEVKISILIKRDKSSELIKKLGDKFDLLEN